MTLLLTGKEGNKIAGITIPIPKIPFYSASIAEYRAYIIPYYFNEANNLSLGVDALEKAISKAKPHYKPKSICVINPYNKTGQVLTREKLRILLNLQRKGSSS